LIYSKHNEYKIARKQQQEQQQNKKVH